MGFGECWAGIGKCCRGCLLVCWCFEMGEGMERVSARVLGRVSLRVPGREGWRV